MYLVFLDESGSAYSTYQRFQDKYEKKVALLGEASVPYPFFVLAAIGFQECHLTMLDEWFCGIKRSFLGNVDEQSRQEYEIKGSLLYTLRTGKQPREWSDRGGRKRPRHSQAQERIWRTLQDHQLRGLERSVFDLLGRLRPPIWAVVVKQREVFRRHGKQTWLPHYWALTYLQQRVLHHVQSEHGAYQRALFLMDEISGLSTASQFDEYLATRAIINGTTPWPVDFGRYLVDVPVFGKSHLHQGLQMADLVAHAIGRHVRGEDPLGWFAKLEPFLARHWSTGHYENAGLTVIR